MSTRTTAQVRFDDRVIQAIAGQIATDLAAGRRGIPTDSEIGERMLAILEDQVLLAAALRAASTRRGEPVTSIVAAIRRITAGRL